MKEDEPNDRQTYKLGDQRVDVTKDGDPSPFVARKSKRFIMNEASSDGDIWREHLIVIQVPVESRRKKACKSLYKNRV